jgi:hypothetical protein
VRQHIDAAHAPAGTLRAALDRNEDVDTNKESQDD